MNKLDSDVKLNNEIKILPADKPLKSKINWTICEYSGCEIHFLNEGNSVIEEPLCLKNQLKDGMRVAVPGLFGGYHLMIVQNDCSCAVTESGDLIATLSFGEDDRKCWVASGLINTNGIKNLTKSTKEAK